MSDAKTQESAVDCRECMHGHNFEHGLGYRCAKADARMPWSVVASDPCEEFEAAPPASAGREEPGLLEAARAAFPLLTDWDVDPESDDDGQWEADCRAFKAETGLTYGPLTHRSFKSWSVRRDRRVRNDLAAAISSEEARRSQPAAEDPRDEEIAKLRRQVEFLAATVQTCSIETQRLERLVGSMLREHWLRECVIGLYYGEHRWVLKLQILVKKLRGSGTVRVWTEAGDEEAIQQAEAALAEWAERDEAVWARAIEEAQAHPPTRDPRDALLERCANTLASIGRSHGACECGACPACRAALELVRLRAAGVEPEGASR